MPERLVIIRLIMDAKHLYKNAKFIASNATLIGSITLKEDVSVWFGAVLRADKDSISIGARSNIQDNCVIHTSTGDPTIVGDGVSVGHSAILHGCTVEDNVLIGMGAIVLNGARVGEGSIIGAGAVVTEGKEIPPRSLVLGVPGKVVREVPDAQYQSTLENAQKYVELAKEYAGEYNE
jgi:carbonic anhydrase/acetyltransferase-like protein (isoleucine patch superfamily)